VQSQQTAEDNLRSRVRALASSISSGSRGINEMSVLAQETAALPLAHLAYWERVVRDEFSSTPHPSMFAREVTWAKSGRILTWVDLVSRDGYVRERTLRALSGPAPNSFFLALAARRLNDWVPQVRQAAMETLPTLARNSDPEHVVDVVCALLPMWMFWRRAAEAERQVLLGIMSNKAMAASLERRLTSATAGPMATVLSQAGRTSVLDQHLKYIAQAAVQPTVRVTAYRALLSGRVVWLEGRAWQWTDVRYCEGRMFPVLRERPLDNAPPLQEVLLAAAADRSPMVRRVAAEALIRELSKLGSAALPLAHQFAADPSRPVAERGEFVLRQFVDRADD
jgi:hypothetical protein